MILTYDCKCVKQVFHRSKFVTITWPYHLLLCFCTSWSSSLDTVTQYLIPSGLSWLLGWNHLPLLDRPVNLGWIIDIVLDPCWVSQSLIPCGSKIQSSIVDYKLELLAHFDPYKVSFETLGPCIVYAKHFLLPRLSSEGSKNLNLAGWLYRLVRSLKVHCRKKDSLVLEEKSVVPPYHVSLNYLLSFFN